MDHLEEQVIRLYGELMFLKPAIKWLLAREATQSDNASAALADLSAHITREIESLQMNENVKAMVQTGLDGMLADVLAAGTKKS
jgi:hypothetical protein